MEEYDLSWEFDFGKHKGQTIDDISSSDTGFTYLCWSYKSIPKFRKVIDHLSKPSKEELKVRIKRYQNYVKSLKDSSSFGSILSYRFQKSSDCTAFFKAMGCEFIGK